jgi:hypothetical protein
MDKPIIGIKPWGRERVPNSVREAADKIVGWKSDGIVNAIREYAL